MDAIEFGRELSRAKSREERIAQFGAVLSRETNTEVEVVGGSAIEIYLSSTDYVSEDIDLVGERTAIERVLQRWKFRQVEGRSKRSYWTHPTIGLIDIVGATDRSGLPPRRIQTRFGPVTITAPEPLIVRRLFRSKREASDVLFRQAVALARLGDLDWQYLASESIYEGVEAELDRVRKILRK